MSNLLMAMPGRDYPIGYLVAIIFFIAAVALFIISFFVKEDIKPNKQKDLSNGNADESDLYSQDYDTPALEYSENFADEIIKMIEEEEKSQSASENQVEAEQAATNQATTTQAATNQDTVLPLDIFPVE